MAFSEPKTPQRTQENVRYTAFFIKPTLYSLRYTCTTTCTTYYMYSSLIFKQMINVFVIDFQAIILFQLKFIFAYAYIFIWMKKNSFKWLVVFKFYSIKIAVLCWLIKLIDKLIQYKIKCNSTPSFEAYC